MGCNVSDLIKYQVYGQTRRTMLTFFFQLCNLFLVVASGAVRNDGIHLAVTPKCGKLSGVFADVNAGLLPLEHYRTIVAFGVRVV